MRTGIAIATMFGLTLALSTIASADSSEPRVRQASRMRAQAAEMRDKANHLRDGEGVKRPNVTAAKALERKADALRAKADRLDSQQWPPNER